MTCASLACARPPQGGPIGCSPPHAPLEGSFHVWPWGSLDTPPKGVVPRYPPRGVLRDCSRPVPGSCWGVVSPLSGGFPHRKDSKKAGMVSQNFPGGEMGETSTGGGSVRNTGHVVIAGNSHICKVLVGASCFVLPSDNRVTCTLFGALGCNHVQPSASYGGKAARVPVSGFIHRLGVLRVACQHVHPNSLKELSRSDVCPHVSPLRACPAMEPTAQNSKRG